ncbi:MAG TPA: hypothetical protein VG168_14050 [Bryobacteraceae bacterium]|nr:hypothetical protein [Bryobacteraceae bacterium]
MEIYGTIRARLWASSSTAWVCRLDTIQRTGKSQSYYLLAVGVRWDIGMDLKRVAMRTLFLLWAQISVLSAQGPELYKAIAQYNPLAQRS